MAKYDLKKVPLDLLQAKTVIASRGVQVASVGVIDLPGGAASHCYLRFGASGAAVPLNLLGQNFDFDPAEDEGIWLDTDQALPGLTLQLLVSFTVRADT